MWLDEDEIWSAILGEEGQTANMRSEHQSRGKKATKSINGFEESHSNSGGVFDFAVHILTRRTYLTCFQHNISEKNIPHSTRHLSQQPHLTPLPSTLNVTPSSMSEHQAQPLAVQQQKRTPQRSVRACVHGAHLHVARHDQVH